MERRSLKLPITLGVVLIILVLLLTTGWVLLNVFTAIQDPAPHLYWVLLTVGAICFLLVLIGIIIYLVLSIKVINSTARQANFIDAVTHELKTPIASLKLLLQTLNRQEVSDEEREQFYRLMLADAQRLDTMINQVLAAARLDQPISQERIDDVCLSSLLNSIVGDFQTSHPNAKLELVTESCIVRAPESELRILINNLVNNAIKYGGTPPLVQVTSHFRADDHEVQILVKDNGKGIALRDRARIFRRFVRLENELERRTKGTGLGLYLVKTIASRLRGTVRVLKSDSRNGTTFEVRLPAISSASSEPQCLPE
ncbi:MAG: HAMP domain-containing histidine kinase [Planctomycetaceae bacterium]|jgi:two-component system, OmpR family, phosphate regulon sensor histidine kinase PhoR|nr:HAMP domain-containing histidine kinase [Planctomycetaceae bacterium]